MLKIEWDDVIGVLQSCTTQIAVILGALILMIIALVACRKMKKSKKFMIRSQAVIAAVLAVLITANSVCFGPLSTLISLAAGNGTVSEETAEEAKEVAQRVAEEGFVLLKNDNGALPLQTSTKLNLFGWAASSPIYGGSGSGGINDLYEIVSLQKGIEDAGFEVNQELLDFYSAYTSDRPEMSIQKQSWTLPEPPVSTYSQELIDNARAFSDTAVIVIARAAGEGHNDMPMDMSQAKYDDNSAEYKDFEAGEHYLQLSQTEKDMVDLVCSNFNNVVVIYNGANPIEMGFVEDYSQIKAAIWCAGPGNVGFEALGEILSGKVNPSGRTPDTFPYDLEAAPWWNNGTYTDYTNLADMAVEGMNAGKPQVYAPSFVDYVEGIYVGYKYYETADAEGIIDYDKTVQYPFGYGLSYTTFTQEMSNIKDDGTSLSFDVTVTNTGSVTGKDVVEVYYNPPYTNGGIEKASANLITFEKTGLLEPGASETITVTFDKEEMASYDMSGTGCYVLEKGDYVISINSDSHNILDSKTYTQNSDIRYDADNKRDSDAAVAVNQFGDAAGDITYLSRADGFANLTEATAAPSDTNMAEKYVEGYHLNANYDYTTDLDPSDEMPITGAKNGIRLADLQGADYDDPRWDDLLDELTIDEMVNMTAMCGYQTPAAESVGKVATGDFDGPAAINNNFTGAGSIGFPVEVVIASTWNKELVEEYGEAMGKMSKEMNGEGWYAPGMNTHRTPFGARNYEYYSEDGVLAGYMGASAVSGAMKQGVYSYIKHFVLYDGNAKMVCVWSNEQAIREIYLKPFEISVKKGGANALMVSWSFIGNKWAGDCDFLFEDVLRGEWGFRGMVISDFFRNNGHGFMNADMALTSGMDAMLSTYDAGPNKPTDTSNPTTVKEMRRACKNIMYTVVNSWAYENGDVSVGMMGWQKAFIAGDILVVIILAAVEFTYVRNGWKKRKEEEIEL